MLNTKNDSNQDLKSWLLENQTDFSQVSSKPTKPKFPCGDCGGTGVWRKVTYNGPYEGKCFKCNGKGGFATSPESRKKSKLRRLEKERVNAQNNVDAFISDTSEEVYKHIVKGSVQYNPFFESLHESIKKYGSLTEKQLNAVHKSMAREVDNHREATESKATVDLSIIKEKLERAVNKGKLSKPKLSLMSECGIPFTFSFAPESGNNAGYVYVKKSREYLGKISPEGEFFGYKTPDADLLALVSTIQDSSESVVRYGRVTGKCGVCSRKLTRKDSINKGIGPICADRFGL